MSNNLEELSRRAVACKHFRWIPGMLALGHSKARVIEVEDGEPYFYADGYRYPLVNDLPDLADPATLGCLLALVREAWNDPTLGLFAVRGGRSGRPARVWAFEGRNPRRRGFDKSIANAFFGSEAAALVFGLEAAP